ncbi:MAG TPA: hypothetical protein VHK47_05310 [Polyangia bacterium]|jgi:hypothetical protein|nr:hypothetical protein [Polyangia bacterium]
MSVAKRALRKAIEDWLANRGPAPSILRSCDACGEERWRPLDRRHAQLTVDAHLADGRRADLTLAAASGRVRLIVQLEGGSRLPNRALETAPAPLVVLEGAAALADPLRWRPVRERGLPRWRCRCALARPLPVDDAFSLRVLGCPLSLRRDEAANAPASPSPAYASVIHDCGRCGFFVGLGYADAERRRVALYCGFGRAQPKRALPRVGAAPAPRLGPTPAPGRAPPPIVDERAS